MPTGNSAYFYYSSNGVSYTTTKKDTKRNLNFYIRCIKWLYYNRHWKNTRQKYKAMAKECDF